jgi:hypothetical protein
MPRAPFFGFQMTLDRLGRKAKLIFYPTIFGIAWWANCAPYPIAK